MDRPVGVGDIGCRRWTELTKLQDKLPMELQWKAMPKKSQRSLTAWTKQKWRTKSGKPSTQGPKATGERYLPEKAIKALSAKEYAATTRAKRKATKG